MSPKRHPDYTLGFTAGVQDAECISQPINTGGHTREKYLAVKKLYELASSPFADTTGNYSVDYLDGYAKGFDSYVIQQQQEGATRK